jgi:E3 ubiquitin-protein ligase RNF19A
MHKRIIQRIPNKLNATQHRAMSLDSNSGSNNIPETIEPEEQIIDMPTITQEYTDSIASKLSSPTSSTKELKSKSPQPAKKELSKTSILRSIFFSGSSNSKS